MDSDFRQSAWMVSILKCSQSMLSEIIVFVRMFRSNFECNLASHYGNYYKVEYTSIRAVHMTKSS